MPVVVIQLPHRFKNRQSCPATDAEHCHHVQSVPVVVALAQVVGDQCIDCVFAFSNAEAVAAVADDVTEAFSVGGVSGGGAR